MSKRNLHIKTIRAYDVDKDTDGYRVLVDRLWPRGVRKETLQLDCWAKQLAPSTELRKWFDHDVKKWEEFQRRYTDELQAKAEELQQLLDAAGDQTILLIYAAKDEEHSHAIVLRRHLENVHSA